MSIWMVFLGINALFSNFVVFSGTKLAQRRDGRNTYNGKSKFGIVFKTCGSEALSPVMELFQRNERECADWVQ